MSKGCRVRRQLDINGNEVRTDVVYNSTHILTLTEAKMPNRWYHKDFDDLFTLQARGFHLLKNGSKKALIKHGLL